MSKLRTAIIALAILLIILPACTSDSESVPATTQTPLITESPPTQTVEPITLQLELTGEPWGEKFLKGLSGRTSLDGGMLFDFEDTVTFGFQMEDTLIPLSIAFVSEELLIVKILDMEPLSKEHYGPSASYRYAVEVNQGFFTQNRIEVGNQVEFQPSTVEGYTNIVFLRN